MADIKKRTGITDYDKYVKERMPKSRTFSECARAFLCGGAICAIGEAVRLFGSDVLGFDEKLTAAFTAVVLVFAGALLTGLGIYDVIGRFAGAGSIVPITGFANSIVAPAMEWKREGYVMGVGAKLFTVAGPVLVYGISASVAAGVIYYIFF